MSGELSDLFAVTACGAVVTAAEALTIPLLRRAAIIDIPGQRSSHTVPTPRGGGIPVAAGLIIATAVIGGRTATVFAFAVLWFGLLGLAEDVRGLRASHRLIMQVVGSAVIVAVLVNDRTASGVVLVLLVPLGAIWMTGFVNAFNFMDGVNGISGAHALIAGIAYACLGGLRHNEFMVPAGAIVAVSALAFLPWNAGQARVFLGDVGSYALGAALAFLAAYAVLHGIPLEAAIGPLVLYVADTAWTLQRRIRAGERWLEPHRTHIYQRWCDAGWSHQRVTMTAATVTILLSLLGAASMAGAPALRVTADLAAAGVVLAYLRSPAVLARRTARAEL